MSRAKTRKYDITWLLQHTAEDSIGKIHFNDLQQRYTLSNSEQLKAQHIGTIIGKCYPTVKVSQEMHLGKRITTYRGIYLTPLNKRFPEIDWTDIFDIIPSSVMLLNDMLSNKLIFAVKSNITSNGNIVLKEITLLKDSLSWGLKVRGKKVNLDELGIKPVFIMTEKSILDILRIVDMLEVCSGKQVLTNEKRRSSMVLERVSSVGDENSDELKMRSSKCTQILSVGSTGSRSDRTAMICRACQVNVTNTKDSAHTKINTTNTITENDRTKILLKTVSIPTKQTTTVEKSDVSAACPKETSDTIELNEDDNNDLKNILESVFPDAPDTMKLLLKSQHDALKCKSKHGRRWDMKIISICLSLWVRSPKNYQTLTDSGMLILPSGRQLKRYKNIVPQDAGLNEKVLLWMHEAAKDSKLSPHGYAGGIHHDETKLQADIVIDMANGCPSLVGWVDLGEEATALQMLRNNKVQRKLATEVIHITFLGYSGFRFPLCHFPTAGIKASELHIIIWKTIAKLKDWGFSVDYIMQDGGSENRSCTNLHFQGGPKKNGYCSPSLIDPTENVFHTQDFSHNIKKLRNSILKSGTVKDSSHTRHLRLNGKSVIWEYWIKAVQWDWEVNGRRIHYRVTESHLYPNISEKMRNELAETMLNRDMLNLLKCFRESQFDGSYLDSSVQLLEVTSSLIDIFRSKTLITSMSDDRFGRLSECRTFFLNWRKEVEEIQNVSKSDKQRMLPSGQCLDDMESLLSTFPSICEEHFKRFPVSSIKPSRFNNDIAENLFCQQKGVYNGCNSNPTYYNYSKSVNSILLGQSLKSRGRKSNAGLESAKSFSQYTNAAVVKRVKSSSSKCIRV